MIRVDRCFRPEKSYPTYNFILSIINLVLASKFTVHLFLSPNT